jgi:hypothetical protein
LSIGAGGKREVDGPEAAMDDVVLEAEREDESRKIEGYLEDLMEIEDKGTSKNGTLESAHLKGRDKESKSESIEFD